MGIRKILWFLSATSKARRPRGKLLWGVTAAAGGVLLAPGLRAWYNRWGTTSEEVARLLPGDELVPHPKLGYTRAITIRAAAARIWPWLVQMGQGRGGLYSYDWLENLAGCDIHSADRVVPELQDLRVGDLVRLGPPGYPCFRVVTLQPNRALVLRGADPKTTELAEFSEPRPRTYSDASWQFFLDEQEDGTTRLIVRQRLDYSPNMAALWHVVEPVNFIMERAMLRGIKQRVEATKD